MTVHLIITGKVQGVFFRASTKEQADAIGIKGWVKNTRDGNVEIMASGDKKIIDQFISWCRKGPKAAIVADVKISEREDSQFSGFSIIKG